MSTIKTLTWSALWMAFTKKVLNEHSPWQVVNIDTIGPWSVMDSNVIEHTLYDQTIIDPATGWFESVEISNKTMYNAVVAFDNLWLSRYMRPLIATIDQGLEFMADL